MWMRANFDPRIGDHLANGRIFLAWIRNSISVIVFGFVVTKFGMTLFSEPFSPLI